jgi:hypothetical protein
MRGLGLFMATKLGAIWATCAVSIVADIYLDCKKSYSIFLQAIQII